ncbi:MAG: GNAT family N-acetyltransferase [Rhodanobacter sp.]
MALPRLQTAHGLIRLPEPADAPKWLRYRLENRDHLASWEPLRAANYYTLEQCLQAVNDAREVAALDRGYSLALFDPDEQEMLGNVTLSNVMRGPFQACLLGYGISARWQGRGLMHETLEATLAWVFGELDLHRVMANHLPRNERSARLLERLGFEREGYARDYLKVAGTWQDHVLTAKIRAAD